MRQSYVFLRVRWCLAMAALAATSRPASAQDRPPRAVVVAKIDSIAAAAVKDSQTVGLSIAVVKGTDTLLRKAYGLANWELDVPTVATMIYPIASITKQFTAVAVMRLVEQGKIDLDADLTRYLPDFPTQGNSIPVRRLLDHTSGILEFQAIADYRDRVMARGLPLDSVYAVMARQERASSSRLVR